MRLRRIESLYFIIRGQQVQIEDFRAEIEERQREARLMRRAATGNPAIADLYVGQAEAHEAYVEWLLEQIRTLEGTIMGYHDVKEALTSGLDSEALRLLAGGYLPPAP
jgi:hypothetical protein